nr:MAG TPA: hypothetical protein [Caudoviricetes sp.]
MYGIVHFAINTIQDGTYYALFVFEITFCL